MRLTWLVCGALAVNTYLIGADETNECAVIDPGEAGPVLAALTAQALRCSHILLTHGHFDHVGGVAELQRRTGARVVIHEADAPMIENSSLSLAALAGQTIEGARADLLLRGGETLEVAGLCIRVLHTPGHTKGGVCYVLESQRVIFCGDTIFHDDAGRTDLPGGSAKALYDSIEHTLFALAGDYTLYCGHEEQTTLEHERKNNPFACSGRRRAW